MAYSRLQSNEEKKNITRAYLTIIGSIIFLVVLIFYGFPIVGKITTFVSDTTRGNKITTTADHTPPAPPRFNSFPNYTNQQNYSLTGTSEAGATIKLTFNGASQDTLADKNGNFSFNLNLITGDNVFSAIAVDTAGNKSQGTQDYKIIFDNKPPSLTISSPNDKAQFFGSNQRQVTIKGSTDSGVQITVNDRIVAVEDSGDFSYTTSLSQGDNKFTIKATDPAGNTTSKDFTLTFNE